MKRIRVTVCTILALALSALIPAGCQKRETAGTTVAESSYKDWPQVQFNDIRILLATDKELAQRGFAIADDSDFENTIIIFPGISEGTTFVNRNQGYGSVGKDIKIVFLDSGMRILKEDIMEKETGLSTAPAGTAFAIEGLPVKKDNLNKWR